ncbi:MAG: flippase-like domain-containing protein [Sandaracinaceae bacterium]|nr:flippase-like domain-containing protein [Myxococcales bacterium]MCB9656548.1 flippase-like domain-containing protein [Sandaracinaceae bacterium]
MARTLKLLFSVSLLLGMLVWIATHDGLTQTLAALERVTTPWLLAGVGVQLLAVLAGVARWRTLLASQQVALGAGFLTRHYLIGRFVGVFTPSTLGLDGYRVVATSRETGRTAAGARAVLIEKGLSFASLAATSFALLPLGAARFYGPAGLLASLGLGLGALAGLYAMHRPAWLRAIARRSPPRLRGPLEKLVGALSADRITTPQLLGACGLGAVTQLCGAATFVCTGLALHVGASPVELLVVGHAIVLAMLLPVSVAGAGLREGTAVAMLGLVGVPMSDALLVGVLGFVVTQPAAVLGGALQVLEGARERQAKGAAQPATPHAQPGLGMGVLSRG